MRYDIMIRYIIIEENDNFLKKYLFLILFGSYMLTIRYHEINFSPNSRQIKNRKAYLYKLSNIVVFLSYLGILVKRTDLTTANDR